MEYITGTYIISKIANLFVNTPIYLANFVCHFLEKEKFAKSKFSIDLNFGPFEILKRQLILRQIKNHISQLRL